MNTQNECDIEINYHNESKQLRKSKQIAVPVCCINASVCVCCVFAFVCVCVE